MRTNLTFLFFLLLVGAGGVTGVYAQAPKKLAVLVVGMGDAKGDDYAQRMGAVLNRNGGYVLQTKDNNTAVANKLAELRAAHTTSTPADTTGLAAWGRQNDVDFVRLVVETGGPKIRFLTALLLNCSTGQPVGRGAYRRTTVSKELNNPLPVMVPVAGGVFQMGCKSDRDGSCSSNETLHWVKVNSFSIGKYPVTQAQWMAVMQSQSSSDNTPMVGVTYNNIVGKDGFLDKLNALTGMNFRLPTEAEWEYAARGCDAGACESFPYSGSDKIDSVAWYSGNSSSMTHAVGGKSPNALGIYDMSGNVYEWCSDGYDQYYGAGSSSALTSTTQVSPIDNPTGDEAGTSRVVRGGSWNYVASSCRVASRNYYAPGFIYAGIGFRLVLP